MTVFFHVDAFSQSFARLTLYLLSPGADCISLSMENLLKLGEHVNVTTELRYWHNGVTTQSQNQGNRITCSLVNWHPLFYLSFGTALSLHYQPFLVLKLE